MRALRTATLALVFLACSQKVNLSPVASWAATLAYMGEQWIDNRVPTSLMKDSIQAAQKEVEKVKKKSSNPHLEELVASLAALEKAVDDGDKNAVAREIPRCRRIHEALE
jgi:23S rRNA maturation mini-RNase III